MAHQYLQPQTIQLVGVVCTGRPSVVRLIDMCSCLALIGPGCCPAPRARESDHPLTAAASGRPWRQSTMRYLRSSGSPSSLEFTHRALPQTPRDTLATVPGTLFALCALQSTHLRPRCPAGGASPGRFAATDKVAPCHPRGAQRRTPRSSAGCEARRQGTPTNTSNARHAGFSHMLRLLHGSGRATREWHGYGETRLVEEHTREHAPPLTQSVSFGPAAVALSRLPFDPGEVRHRTVRGITSLTIRRRLTLPRRLILLAFPICDGPSLELGTVPANFSSHPPLCWLEGPGIQARSQSHGG